MKNFFIEKLEYNQDSNEKVFNLIFENEKSYSAYVEKLLCHSINAHHIWNQRILGAEEKLGVWEISNLEKLQKINTENYAESKQIITYLSFENEISYTNSKQETFKNTVEDIIYHIINHSTYHRGQIMTSLKAEGAIPVATDYIFYKRKKA